jgi:hypothetical protein
MGVHVGEDGMINYEQFKEVYLGLLESCSTVPGAIYMHSMSEIGSNLGDGSGSRVHSGKEGSGSHFGSPFSSGKEKLLKTVDLADWGKRKISSAKYLL